MAEGARLESVFRGNSNVGSNPTLSARFINPQPSLRACFVFGMSDSFAKREIVDSGAILDYGRRRRMYALTQSSLMR